MALLVIPLLRGGTGKGVMLRILAAITLPISFTIFMRKRPRKGGPIMVREHIDHPPAQVMAQQELRGFRRYHLPERIAVKRHTFEDLFPWESIRKHPRKYRSRRVLVVAPQVAPPPPPAAPAPVPTAAEPVRRKNVLVRCGPEGYEIRTGTIAG